MIHKNTTEWSQKQKQANLPDWETSVERYGINNNLEYQSNEIKLTIYIYIQISQSTAQLSCSEKPYSIDQNFSQAD